jgi:cytochrome P450
MKATTDRKDFYYYLLEAKDPATGGPLPTTRLWGEATILIVAGSDTTATAFASVFFYLVHNVAVLEKLKHEVRSKFADIEEIQGHAVNSCTYLRACIDEALRMSPPLPGILPRDVLPGGDVIDGHAIPEGIEVAVSTYSLHHNDRYFPSPHEYQPERWLASESGTSKESIALAQSALCPFSIGVRNCLGKNMAYIEMMDTIARIVWQYDMKLVADASENNLSKRIAWSKDEFAMEDIFISKRDGPLIEFVERRVSA